jgi:hypothetical protein
MDRRGNDIIVDDGMQDSAKVVIVNAAMDNNFYLTICIFNY